MSTQPRPRGARQLLSLGLLGLTLTACTAPSSDPPSNPLQDAQAVHDATVAAGAARDPIAADTPADPSSVCRLLTDSQVRAIFPSAHAGERERTREQYGISACVWSGDFGRMALQTWPAKGRSADSEARSMISGFVDPLSSAAAGNIHYESIAGIGEEAVAVLEKQDAPRGVMTEVAMLVVRKNDQTIMLLSDDLAQRDRADALAALKTLGGAAAGRL